MTEDTRKSTWRDRAPRGLVDPFGPRDEPIFTSTDRRWLWRMENEIDSFTTNPSLCQLRRDLAEYLHETCEHHWLSYSEGGDIPAHRQCLWCHEVDWSAA